MAIVKQLIDGNNLAVEIISPDYEISIFSLDLASGAVTSSLLPAKWLEMIEERAHAFIEAAGDLFDLEERRRGAFNFLQRFVNVSPLDDSTLSLTASHSGDVYTLTATVSVASDNAAHLVVNLPHSLGGAVAMASAVTTTGGAVTQLSGEVTGLTNDTRLADLVVRNKHIADDAAISQSKIDGLTSALNARALVSSLANYLTIASASATYLTQTAAAATYQPIGSYLDQAAGDARYQLKGNYLTSADLSPYLQSTTAASTYATITSLSSYLTTTVAASTYATITSLSSYLTTTAAASTYVPLSTKSFVKYTTDVTTAPADWASKNYAPVVDNAAGTTALKSVALMSDLAAVQSGVRYLEAVKRTYTSAPTNATLQADGIVAGDRVFLKITPDTAKTSGIYVAAGAGGTLNIATRADDFAIGDEVAGVYIFDTNAGISYLCKNAAGSDVVGTHVLTFITYTEAVTYTVASGGGLALTGSAFSADNTIARLASPTFTGTVTIPAVSDVSADTTAATVKYVKDKITSSALQIASATVLGGFKIAASGSGLAIDGSGFLTAAVKTVAGKTGAVTLAVADVSGAAPIASPGFTGTPTAPTQATANDSTAIATTAFVKAQGYVTSAAIPAAATTNPADLAQTAVVGTGANFAHNDHVHSWNGIPYDFGGEYGGTPPTTQTEIFHWKSPRKLTFAAAAGDHVAGAKTFPTGSAVVFDIAVKDAAGGNLTTGTMTFNTNGTVSFAGLISVTLPKNGYVVVTTRAGSMNGLDTPYYTFAAVLAS